MKRWIRRLGIALAVIGLTLGILYECATHVGWGWLFGEAFYDGRPTSYWAPRCDDWLERFDDEVSLAVFTYGLPYQLPGEDYYRGWLPKNHPQGGGGMKGNPTTVWNRIRDSLTRKDELERNAMYRDAPRIIWGYPESEPVLKELELIEEYRGLVQLARTRIDCYHKVEAFAAEEKKLREQRK